MDAKVLAELRAAEATGAEIIHGGDLTFNLKLLRTTYGPIFAHPERHAIVMGNHDASGGRAKLYAEEFGTVVGTSKTWLTNALVVEDELEGRPVKVLVTHNPTPELQGCDYNVYGHIHNSLYLQDGIDYHLEHAGPEWIRWLNTSPQHLNACVELHDYRPVSLATLVARMAQLRQNSDTPAHRVKTRAA
jgi:calcineurin-like phosphoesterase family protein